jgi:Ca-activated chloride channel family protein
MTLLNPEYLFLLLLLIPIVVWYIWKLRKARATLQMSSISGLNKRYRGFRVWLIHVPFILRVALIVLVSIALSRPQLSDSWETESTEGIDIMMAMDISGTMLGEDLKPTRLEAAKEVAKEFILARPNDQIGLVLFAGESFTQCPMTTDHAVLLDLFESVEFGMIEDGTAIGLGLANAVNRMKDSSSKSKVVILLTDGSNNSGDIDPETAAEIAQTYGIRVYAIGVGSYGDNIPVSVQTPYGMTKTVMSSEFDEETLKKIAEMTGGEYFRATDNNSLRDIYDQIDKLEKTKIRAREYSKRTEYFMPFLWAALACLILELLIRHFVLRTVSE